MSVAAQIPAGCWWNPARAVAGFPGWGCTAAEAEPESPSDRPSHTPDLEDVRLTLHGDGEAFGRLVERHQTMVWAMMWRFSRDREIHRELVQDVFVEAYRSLGGFRGRAPFSHWLARIATRVGYRHWKRRKRERSRPEVPLSEWDTLRDESLGSLDPQEAGAILHRLLERLPPRDRLVVTLRYVEERSVKEVASLTGWSETMVKVQCYRARTRLRRLFKGFDKGRNR